MPGEYLTAVTIASILAGLFMGWKDAALIFAVMAGPVLALIGVAELVSRFGKKEEPQKPPTESAEQDENPGDSRGHGDGGWAGTGGFR